MSRVFLSHSSLDRRQAIADKVVPGLAALRLLGGNHLLEEVISTMLVGHDQAYLEQPWVSARTIRVDSTDVGVLDFDITAEQTKALYANGYHAAESFLDSWDEDVYNRRFPSGPCPPATVHPDR